MLSIIITVCTPSAYKEDYKENVLSFSFFYKFSDYEPSMT